MIHSILGALAISLTIRPGHDQLVSYRKQIAPIFAASCNACHGGPNPQSAFNLTTFAGLVKGGRRGASPRVSKSSHAARSSRSAIPQECLIERPSSGGYIVRNVR